MLRTQLSLAETGTIEVYTGGTTYFDASLNSLLRWLRKRMNPSTLP